MGIIASVKTGYTLKRTTGDISLFPVFPENSTQLEELMSKDHFCLVSRVLLGDVLYSNFTTVLR